MGKTKNGTRVNGGAILGHGSLDHEDLEHHHGVEWRPTALGAACVGKRCVQIGTEYLEINRIRPVAARSII